MKHVYQIVPHLLSNELLKATDENGAYYPVALPVTKFSNDERGTEALSLFVAGCLAAGHVIEDFSHTINQKGYVK
jgi:hypothetical protein